MAHSSSRALARPALVGLALLALAPAAAPAAKKATPERFAGTCEMSGVIRHSPPMTMVPAQTEIRGNFRGVCSGKLTDRKGRTRKLTNAPASYEGLGKGELSCMGGIATGTGKLRFGKGRVIDFRLTERRGPGVATVTLEGKAGGTGVVAGTVSKDQDLQTINEQCMGTGLDVLRGDAKITSPGIAG